MCIIKTYIKDFAKGVGYVYYFCEKLQVLQLTHESSCVHFKYVITLVK